MTTWDEAAREVAAQTVKIETHDSWGTRFLIYGDLESWVTDHWDGLPRD